jgi:GxxExxY protein
MAKGLLYQDLTYRVRAALFKVHNTLGPGFREETYKRALLLELNARALKAELEHEFDVYYEGKRIDVFRLDLIVEGAVILELKAVEALTKLHEAQLFSYLKASGLKVGLLVNFGQPSLQIWRRVL